MGDRTQGTRYRNHGAWGMALGEGSRAQETRVGNRRQSTGDRAQETGNRMQEYKQGEQSKEVRHRGQDKGDRAGG